MRQVTLEGERLSFSSITTVGVDSGKDEGDLSFVQKVPADVLVVRKANHHKVRDGSDRASYDTLHDEDLRAVNMSCAGLQSKTENELTHRQPGRP